MRDYKTSAINFLHRRQFKAAEKYFRKHYLETKNKWELHNSLGNVYRAKKDFKKAINYYKKSLKSKSDFGLAWSNLSAALAEGGNYKDAIKSAQKALKILPKEMGGIHKNLIPQLKKEISEYSKKLGAVNGI